MDRCFPEFNKAFIYFFPCSTFCQYIMVTLYNGIFFIPANWRKVYCNLVPICDVLFFRHTKYLPVSLHLDKPFSLSFFLLFLCIIIVSVNFLGNTLNIKRIKLLKRWKEVNSLNFPFHLIGWQARERMWYVTVLHGTTTYKMVITQKIERALWGK